MRTIDALFMALLTGSVLSGCSHADRIGLKLIQPPNIAASDTVGEAIDQGKRHLDDHNFALAISQFREALRLDPEQAAAHNGLAIAYTSIGRPDLARRHFELAVAYGPSDPKYQGNYERFLGTSQAGAEAALVRAGTGDGPKDGATMANADGSWQLPEPASPAPAERSRSQGPIVVDGSGVAMLLSRPRLAGGPSAKSKTSGPVGRPAASYNLAAFGLAPVLQRSSLYEVRLVTIATSSRTAASAANVAKYNGSLAEASFWGAVDGSRARVQAAKSSQSDSGCGGGSSHVPRWAAQLTVQIRQCSA